MHELVYRLLVLIWFVAYMAAIYLGLHIVLARFISAPESRLLWFFSVVTTPLTAPVRAVLPRGIPEGRVRWITLALCLAVWLCARLVLAGMGGVDLG
jgi:uncharacterized protein YggT (Ycf19 family)